MDRPERHLGFLLHDVARLLRKRFEQNARPLGLTRSQAQVLAHLALHQGIAQRGLAEILEIEPITLTRLLDGMERGGLVERRPHPSDRRVRRLFLTRKGRGRSPVWIKSSRFARPSPPSRMSIIPPVFKRSMRNVTGDSITY